MPAQVYVPPVNETTAAFQFDSSVVMSGNSLSSEQSSAQPASLGFAAATMNPLYTSSITTGATGTVYLNSMMLPAGMVISNLYMVSLTIPGTVTQGLLGIYNAAGTLVASAAGLGAFTTGLKQAPLTTPYTVPSSGMYWGALAVSWATTAPTFAGAAPGAGIIGGVPTLSITVTPFATNGTQASSLAASITLASNVDSTLAFWIGAN